MGELTAKQADSAMTGLMWAMVAPIANMNLIPTPREGYSDAEMASVVNEANARIEAGNRNLRKVQREAANDVKALRLRLDQFEEHAIEMQDENRLLREMIVALQERAETAESQLEASNNNGLPMPDASRTMRRNQEDTAETIPAYRR